MKSQDFLIMMEQDLVTMPDGMEKSMYSTLLSCMRDAVGSTVCEIDSTKSLQGGYEEMRRIAEKDYKEKNGQKNGGCCVDIPSATNLMRTYLGIPVAIPESSQTASVKIAGINLDDYLD